MVPCAICVSANSLQYHQGVASGGMAVPVGKYLGFRPKGQSTLSSGQKPQPLAGMETCICCCVPSSPDCCGPHAVPRQQILTRSWAEFLYMAPKLLLPSHSLIHPFIYPSPPAYTQQARTHRYIRGCFTRPLTGTKVHGHLSCSEVAQWGTCVGILLPSAHLQISAEPNTAARSLGNYLSIFNEEHKGMNLYLRPYFFF